MAVRSRIFAPMLLAATLALGFAILWGMGLGFAWTLFSQFTQNETVHEDVVALADGTLLIKSYTRNYNASIYRTFDGRPVAGTEMKSPLRGAGVGLPGRPWGSAARLPWGQRLRTFHDCQQPANYWYFIHDGKREGTGFLVGFNSQSKNCIGYIGKSGFCQDEPAAADRFAFSENRRGTYASVVSSQMFFGPAEPYSAPPLPGKGQFLPWQIFLITLDGLVEVDLRQRTVRTCLDEEIQAAGMLSRVVERDMENDSQPEKGEERIEFLAVRVDDEILVLDPSGRRRQTYPIPEQLQRGRLTLYGLSDDTVLLRQDVRKHDWRTAKGQTRVNCWRVDQEGSVLKRETCKLVPYSTGSGMESLCWDASGLVPVPALITPFLLIAELRELLEDGSEPTYGAALGTALRATWLPLLLLNLFAAAMAWFCARRQRRYAAGWTKTWVAFVFLAGLPGLVGYLCCRRWPVRVPCKACGQATPRDRAHCAQCGETFAAPAETGIEVYA